MFLYKTHKPQKAFHSYHHGEGGHVFKYLGYLRQKIREAEIMQLFLHFQNCIILFMKIPNHKYEFMV